MRFDDQMFIKCSERQIGRQIERKIDRKKDRRAQIINKHTALPWHGTKRQKDRKTETERNTFGRTHKQTLKKRTALPWHKETERQTETFSDKQTDIRNLRLFLNKRGTERQKYNRTNTQTDIQKTYGSSLAQTSFLGFRCLCEWATC